MRRCSRPSSLTMCSKILGSSAPIAPALISTQTQTVVTWRAVISETRTPESVRPPLKISSSHSAGYESGVCGFSSDVRVSEISPILLASRGRQTPQPADEASHELKGREDQAKNSERDQRQVRTNASHARGDQHGAGNIERIGVPLRALLLLLQLGDLLAGDGNGLRVHSVLSRGREVGTGFAAAAAFARANATMPSIFFGEFGLPGFFILI